MPRYTLPKLIHIIIDAIISTIFSTELAASKTEGLMGTRVGLTVGDDGATAGVEVGRDGAEVGEAVGAALGASMAIIRL